ncbi:putative histone deacetylase complex subunit cti6 [Amphibalanus amphitrite]|uniref:putative histone deacetylase complex subunit cti6 n=1 Tax=Amphibalanus amphitrite TaxID=1232801 RepID=UPI001C901A0E|nr:putative histone deacetylase complex subunit cti6 [Amphibalanus amphitrite]
MSTRARLGSNASSQNADSQCVYVDGEEADEGEGGAWRKKGRKTRKTKYTCKGGKKVCGLAVADGEDSIQCDLCEQWFHPNCQGLDDKAFQAISDSELLWLCMTCKPNLMDVLRMGKRLEDKLEAVERKIIGVFKVSGPKPDQNNQLEEKINALEKVVVEVMNKQQAQVDKSLEAQKEVVQTMPKLQSELKKSAQELKTLVERKEDKEKREVNLIIHNVPESKSSDPEARKGYDLKSFSNIKEALLGEGNMEVDKIYRLGKKRESENGEEEPKPRLMLVRLKKKEHVEALMSKRWDLRKTTFDNVYLTRDLTPEEREVQKKLREELIAKGRETHRVFRGKVVPRQ